MRVASYLRDLFRRAGTLSVTSRSEPPSTSHHAALSRVSRLGVVAIAAVAFLLAGVAIYQERERALRDGAARAARLSLVLQEQTLRAMQAVDLTLQNIVDAVVVSTRPSHDGPFEEALRKKRDQLPFVRALFVIGTDGFITQDTDHPNTPRVTLADRPYFRLHRDDPGVGLHIGEPLVSRSVNRWFVSMSRRINDANGRFMGIAVAAVEPRYFDEFYQKLGMGQTDSIALFRRDGILYWRTPYIEDKIGTSFAHLALFQREIVAHRSHVYRAQNLVTGAPLMVSHRVLEGLPFVVTVGLDEHALLAAWRRTALGAITATVLLVGLVAAVFLLVSRYARQRAEMHDRLLQTQKLEALGTMISGVAHDFGNVLNVVGVNLALLRKEAAPVPASVEKAIAAVEQGTTLASQLLAFARRQQLTIESCDANELVSGLVPLLKQAVGPSVDVTLTLAEKLWLCRTDSAQFNSAILNLVINARHAMTDGKGVIRIATENRAPGRLPSSGGLRDGEYVCVTVIDNGRGMPAEVLRRAPEPFYTTRREGSGTGLGLSQIYGFAQQVGGGLQIDSAEGRGTSVHLFFPRAEALGVRSATSA